LRSALFFGDCSLKRPGICFPLPRIYRKSEETLSQAEAAVVKVSQSATTWKLTYPQAGQRAIWIISVRAHRMH
jgi:hypothetical protein